MTFTQRLLTATMLFLLPQATLAYLNPEEVLLNKDLYLPPAARDAQGRSNVQAEEAAARREREQEAAFDLQHPAAPEEELVEEEQPATSMQLPAGYIAIPLQGGMFPATVFGSAPQANQQTLDTANLELLRTMRMLGRVNQNQVLQHSQSIHEGAPPLTPSGAGAVVSALTMAGAVFTTMYRAAKAKVAVLS